MTNLRNAFCLSILLLTTAPLALAQGAYAQIDYPGSILTEAFGIDTAGDVVGTYEDISKNYHGFLLSGGVYTAIDYPGDVYGTGLYGINDLGQVVGEAGISAQTNVGFVYDLKSQTFTEIAYPGASYTAAMAINNAGEIVGIFSTPNQMSGFELIGSTFTEITAPQSFETIPDGITDSGVVVGTSLATNQSHWVNFVFANGAFNRLEIPTDNPVVNGVGGATRDLVGAYSGASVGVGFVYRNKVLTTLRFPGGSDATAANGINTAGEVVGWFHNTAFRWHGFLWTPPADAERK